MPLGQRDGPSTGGTSRKVQLILPLDLENALEAFWSAAEESRGHFRQKHGCGEGPNSRRAGGCKGQISSADMEFSNSSLATKLWLSRKPRQRLHVSMYKTNEKRALPVNAGKGARGEVCSTPGLQRVPHLHSPLLLGLPLAS